MERISTGVSTLDTMLKGGYEVGAITLLYGGPGTGKTNLALCFSVNLAKNNDFVIFIDTESISPERLHSFTGGRKEIASRILFYRVRSFDEQEDAIKKSYALLARNLRIRAIVIDSFTEFYNLDMGHMNSLASLSKQLGILEALAKDYSLSVLLTSRVYYSFREGKIKNVAGYYMNPAIRTIIRLERIDDLWKAVLEKHRTLVPGKEAFFKISPDSVTGVE
ncbi:MAG: ATPase domain-containing protein [Thermoplasmata archaeon]